MSRWPVRTVTMTILMAVSGTIIMTTLALSYDQLAARLGIAVPSARRLVHRKRWSKGKGNDGRAIVQVPAEFFDGREDGLLVTIRMTVLLTVRRMIAMTVRRLSEGRMLRCPMPLSGWQPRKPS